MSFQRGVPLARQGTKWVSKVSIRYGTDEMNKGLKSACADLGYTQELVQTLSVINHTLSKPLFRCIST